MELDYSPLMAALEGRLAPLAEVLPRDFPAGFRHGDLPGWLEALAALPALRPATVELQERVRIGEAGQCGEAQRAALAQALQGLHPWRKGPFELFGLALDTEWRSDWKWDRLKQHVAPLAGRRVLDVGCGNGYHCWRMAGEGARLALGVDSHLLFVMQYWAIRRFLPEPPVWVVPLALEDLPARLQGFDTVFSMGVLYHRRSPMDHLLALRDCLRPGGELVLETLVVEGGGESCLVPRGRYARMPNVWFLPSGAMLGAWLEKCGYRDVRLVDECVTTTAEQRSTPWMRFDSLARALDPENPARTIEGYPAPRRAVMLARKPE